MAVISFSRRPESTWCVAGWALRQILDDVITQYPGDKEMTEAFDEAKTSYSGLIVDLLQPEIAMRVTDAIRQVATGILSGSIQSGILKRPYGDKRTLEEYRKGLQQLLEVIHSSAAGAGG